MRWSVLLLVLIAFDVCYCNQYMLNGFWSAEEVSPTPTNLKNSSYLFNFYPEAIYYHFRFEGPEESLIGNYTYDDIQQDPNNINFLITEGKYAGETAYGIYRNNSDTSLTVAFCPPGFLYRPVDFIPNNITRVFNLIAMNSPTQIHIAFGPDPRTSMSIAWTTLYDTLTQVQYGTSSGQYTDTAEGEWNSYFYKGYSSGALHYVLLEGLSPNTTYYYQCGNEKDGWSDEYSFRTAPPIPQTSIAVTIFGDINLGGDTGGAVSVWNVSHYTLEGMLLENTDFVIDVGDIAYCNGIQNCWDRHFIDFQALVSKKAYMVCYGNHDVDPEPFGYRNRFYMPTNRTVLDNDDYFYSFDYGPVHFLTYSTELFFLPFNVTVSLDDQMKFIEADLIKASQNRDNVPWIIVIGHRPLYCSDTYQDCSQNVSLSLQRALEPLFYKYQVDMLFAGHMHSMETSYPIVFDGYTSGTMEEPQGTIHITTGAAGQPFLGSYYPMPNYGNFRSLTYGFSRLSVTPESLTHQFIATANFTVVDEFTIKSPWWKNEMTDPFLL